jgi:hypothetical protein
VFQNRGGVSSWYPVYRGLDPQAPLCVSVPAFDSGNGLESNPYQIGSVTSGSGNTVLFPSTITISGLAPFQYVPIADVNTETNDFRFQVTNSFADASGNLTFKLKYTDYPQTLPGTGYTAKLRVGFDAPFFITASIGITFPVIVENPGSITGDPIIGRVLTYSLGNAAGGTPPYTYAWIWKTQSGGESLQSNGNTYVIGPEALDDRVYVQLTATDNSLDSASGNTATLPAPPALIGKGPFPNTDIQYPATLTTTASTTWLDAGTTLRANDCIEFSVDGVSFGQGPTVIANGGTIITRWINSPSCSGADNSVTIYGCIYSDSYQDCDSFHIDRIPSPFSFLPVSDVTPSTVATSLDIVPIGYNSTAYVSYNGISSGSTIQGSLDGGSTWTNLPLAGSTAFPINPGNSLRVRMTVGADFSTGYTAIVNIGQGSTVQSGTFVATTKLPTSFTTPIAFPTITTAEVASTGWVDGSTSLSVTGCLQFKVGVGGTWKSPGDSPTSIANGAVLYTRWSNATPGVCGNAPHGTPLTGTITNTPSGGTKTSIASLTVDRVPAVFTFTDLSGQAVSSVIESNTVNIVGTNAPAFLTLGATNTLTAIQARVGGGSWTTIPSSGETLQIAPVASGPGTTLQIRGTTGSAQNQTYTATVDAGQGTSIQSASWNVTTTAAVPGIVTPSITSPANGATNVNPNSVSPAGVTVSSSAYSAINGAGSHVSSDWEIYYLSGVTPVYVVQSNNNTTNLTSYFVPLSSLGASSTYYTRVRYRTNTPTAVVSSWSNVSQFTIVSPTIQTPTIDKPTISSNNNPYYVSPPNIGIASSQYTPVDGAGSHASTDWQIRKTSTSGPVIVDTSSSSSKISYPFVASLVEQSTSYYVRCRYYSSNSTPVVSSWSPWLQFSTPSNFNLLTPWSSVPQTPGGGSTLFDPLYLNKVIIWVGSPNNLFMIFPVGNGPTYYAKRVMVSSDGSDWSEALRGAPILDDVSSAVYGNGAILAVGGPIFAGSSGSPGSGGNGASISIDGGNTWARAGTFPTPPTSSTSIKSIAYGNSVFVAVGQNGVIFTATNSGGFVTWSQRSSGLSNPNSYNISHVTWTGTQFKATANSSTGNFILTSVNGTSWTSTPCSFKFREMEYVGDGTQNKYVAIPEYSTPGYVQLYYGDGGSSWTPTSVPTSSVSTISNIAVSSNFIVSPCGDPEVASAVRSPSFWPPQFAIYDFGTGFYPVPSPGIVAYSSSLKRFAGVTYTSVLYTSSSRRHTTFYVTTD